MKRAFLTGSLAVIIVLVAYLFIFGLGKVDTKPRAKTKTECQRVYGQLDLEDGIVTSICSPEHYQ